MPCLEIKIKDQIYKITNDSQSDTVTSADWELIYSFLTKGELPEGYYVIGDNEAVHRDKLFDYLLNELSESKTNTELYEGSLTKNISQSEFINKLVGNRDLNASLDGDDTYDTNQVQKNVLWVPTWGNTNNWYGFTNQRALLLTGDAAYASDRKVKTLYRAYLDLKNGSKRVRDAVEFMFNKYSGPDNITDIYEKLTWLANNKLVEIVTALFTPSAVKYQKSEKDLHKTLQNNIDKVTGYYIYSDNKPRYVIKHRGNQNNIVVLDLENNSIKSDININSVKAVYKPFSLRYKNSEYQLLGKTWYKLNQGMYIKTDAGISETLYAQWFGLDINDFETIDFYSKADKSGETDRYGQAPVFANSKIGDQELSDILPEGSKITTSFGTYVKTNNEFIQGEFTLDRDARINNVQIPWNNEELRNKLLTLKSIEDPTPSLNDGDLRIVLQDVFGFKDFDNIFINNNQNELVKVKLFITNDEQVVPRLQISSKSKFKVTKDNYLQLKLGVAYFKYLQDENIPKSELVANANKFWEILKDVVINKQDVDLDDDVKEEIAMITSDLFNDDNEMRLIEAVDLNKQQLFQNLGKTDEEVDAFMKELMDRGLMVVSCEL